MLLNVLWALALLACAERADAGANVWTSSGPNGGRIWSVAVDPTSSQTLYAGTNGGGVFKSTDGAAHWASVSRGLTNHVALYVGLDPKTSTTVYAGTRAGVFRSTDEAATWAAANTGLSGPVNTLGFDPADAQIIYAGSSVGLYKSTDTAGSWNIVGSNTLLSSVQAVFVDPSTPQTVCGCGGTGMIR